MKDLRKALLLLVGAMLLMGLSGMSAAAASDTNVTVTTDNPGTATYIDSASHTLAANSAQWFKFDYNATRNDDGSRNPVTVTVPVLNTPNVGFEVFTPDQLASWWNTEPIGRGSHEGIICGQIDTDWVYTCQTYSLTWTGKFPANGTYYVRVTNNNSYAVNIALTENE